MNCKFNGIIGASKSGKSLYSRKLAENAFNKKETVLFLNDQNKNNTSSGNIYPSQHELVTTLTHWSLDREHDYNDLWLLCGFKLNCDGRIVYYYDKYSHKKKKLIPVTYENSNGNLYFTEIPGGLNVLIYIIALFRLAVRKLNINQKHVNIYLDDVVGVFDKSICNNFFKIVDTIVPKKYQEKISITFTTHSPDFIGSYIRYCRDNRHSNCRLTRLNSSYAEKLIEMGNNEKLPEIDSSINIKDFFWPNDNFNIVLPDISFFKETFNAERLIFVEGTTDEYLVRELVKISPNKDFIVTRFGGHYNINDSLDGIENHQRSAFINYISKMYPGDVWFILDGDILCDPNITEKNDIIQKYQKENNSKQLFSAVLKYKKDIKSRESRNYSRRNLYSFLHGYFPDQNKPINYGCFENSNVKFIYKEPEGRNNGIYNLEKFIKYLDQDTYDRYKKYHMNDPTKSKEIAELIRLKCESDNFVKSIFGFIFDKSLNDFNDENALYELVSGINDDNNNSNSELINGSKEIVSKQNNSTPKIVTNSTEIVPKQNNSNIEPNTISKEKVINQNDDINILDAMTQ